MAVTPHEKSGFIGIKHDEAHASARSRLVPFASNIEVACQRLLTRLPLKDSLRLARPYGRCRPIKGRCQPEPTTAY